MILQFYLVGIYVFPRISRIEEIRHLYNMKPKVLHQDEKHTKPSIKKLIFILLIISIISIVVLNVINYFVSYY
jgi:heme/copper-type cytochrome/quinol oxidase subunit 2